MNIELIVGVLVLLALGYAWYTERTRRKAAEVEAEVAKRRTTVDALNPKLEENKKEYDAAQLELFEHPIPSHMLDNVGKPLPVGGREEGATEFPRGFRPGLDGPSTDPRGSSKTGTAH